MNKGGGRKQKAETRNHLGLTSRRSFLWTLAASGLFFRSRFALADPPPPEEPDVIPPPETLDPAYQPSAYSSDPSTLQRIRIKPPPSQYGTGPWPVAITILPSVFKQGDYYGVPSQRWADRDLAAAGFLVFSIDHRLAPPGFILNQDPTHANPADGRPPEQTNDVKQQILAAYYDSQCNGQIFLVGGSAGGCHALWCALDAAATVPLWPLPTGAIRAVASLSAPCDLSSWVGDNQNNLLKFEDDIKNYTNTTSNTGGDKDFQYSVSPISKVAGATNIPAIRLFYTWQDPVPHQQAEEMFGALNGHADVIKYKVNDGNLHAFNYWHTLNEETGNYVSQDVINFFNQHRS